MTNGSKGMYVNRILLASRKLEKDNDSSNTFFHLLTDQVPSGSSTSSRVKTWRTEWKHHDSKSIHCYQNQILNRNCKGNVTKERDELTEGLGPVSLKPRYWRAGKAVVVYMQDSGFNSFASNMIKPLVSKTKWSSLLARTRTLILYFSIWIFDFGPEMLPGLSRNRPQAKLTTHKPRVSVQVGHVQRYREYCIQQIRRGDVCDQWNDDDQTKGNGSSDFPCSDIKTVPRPAGSVHRRVHA